MLAFNNKPHCFAQTMESYTFDEAWALSFLSFKESKGLSVNRFYFSNRKWNAQPESLSLFCRWVLIWSFTRLRYLVGPKVKRVFLSICFVCLKPKIMICVVRKNKPSNATRWAKVKGSLICWTQDRLLKILWKQILLRFTLFRFKKKRKSVKKSHCVILHKNLC